MRIIFSLIGYMAVATVLTGLLGFGYLWQADRLNDEKMFQIIALVHDIDLGGVSQENEIVDTEIPGEEPSLSEVNRSREIALRDFEAKNNSLERGRNEFNHMLHQLTESRNRIDKIARELEERIKRESELTDQESIKSVVRDLSSVKAERAKELLLKILERGGNDPEKKAAAKGDVIRLMAALPSTTLKGILKRFQSEKELEQLHEIHITMLQGGPIKADLDKVLEQITSRDFSE